MIKSKETRKRIIIYTAFIILLVIIYIGLSNNYFMYEKPIARITDVKNSYKETIDSEKIFKQDILAVVKNGEYKGTEIKLSNTYTYSCVYDEKYTKGNDVFISIKKDGTDFKTSILRLKRDKYIVFMLLIVIFCLIAFCRKRGLLTLISVIFNIVVFYYALVLYTKGMNILLLSIIASVIFSIFTLTVISGFNKKTLSAIVSTLCATLLIGILATIVLLKNDEIDYSFMDFLYMAYEQYDANLIFISEILLCGLGAIMDMSITMTSTVNELISQDDNISIDNLRKSCKEVGKDVMGTMVNVMLFSNLGGCIPFFILSMKNDVPIISLLRYNGFFEITRFMTGSIALLIAIPIASNIAIWMLAGKSKKEREADIL